MLGHYGIFICLGVSGGNYCAGGQGVDISLDGSETGLIYSLYYQQSLIDNMVGNGQQLVFGSFTQQGEYYITAKNDNTGCITTQNGVASIGVYELPIAEAGPNSLINAGGFATLSGSATGGAGGYNYFWTPSDSLINSTSATPSTVPLYNTNMFNLTIIDNQGCESQEDNTIVFVSGGQVSLNILTSGYPVCPGDDVQLYAMASGGSGSFSYFWQSNPTGTSSTLFDPIVNPLLTTTYIVTVSDGLTVITDSVTVLVNPSPAAFMLTGGGVVCEGTDPTNIILQGSETGVDYQLLYDGALTGMTISGTGFSLDFGTWNTNGNYTAHAVNFSSLCDNDMLGNAIVTVNSLPLSLAGPDQLITAGTTTTLSGSAEGGSGAYNYQWQPSYLCVSPTSQNTFTQPISQTTMFSLIASDVQTQCMSLPDTVILFAQGNDLYATATANPGSLCAGSQLTLYALASGGTGNYNYSWSSMPSGFYSSIANPATYPLVSTTYYLDVFDGLSHAYDTIFIDVLSLPVTYHITGGGSYCEGGDGLSLGLSGSEIGAMYSLFRSPNEFVKELSGTGQPLDFGVYSQSGNYYSTAVTNLYCEETMIGESVIAVNPNPNAQAGEDQLILFNEQIVLHGEATSGSGNYGFIWTPTDSLINANIQHPLTVPLGSTTMFNVMVNDNITGCNSSEDNTVVFVSGGPFTLQLTTSAPTVCSGEETQLFALASGGTGNYSYLWTSDPPGFVSSLYNPVVSPTISTVYSVSVSDGNIIINDYITVTVNPLPLPYSLTGGGEVCMGEQSDEIILQNSEINTTYSLLLDGIVTGNNKLGTGFSLDFGSQSQSGDYSIFAVENTTQCANYMAGEISVIINVLPEADAGSDVIIPANTTTILSGSVTNGSGGYTYNWEPTVLCQNAHAQTTLTNLISQTTIFKFEATDLQTQCTSLKDTVIVFTNSGNLLVEATSSLLSICNLQPVNLLALASGGTGSYSYSWTSYPSGFVSSEMNPIAYPYQSTMYYVEVFDGLVSAMDSVYVNVSQSPFVYTMTGGGNYCFGESGVEIGLDGSEEGLLYRLFHFPDYPVVDVIGTGSELSFGSFTEQGDYFVLANADMTCHEQMNGKATIIVDQLPHANAGDDKYISWSDQVVLNGSSLGGSGTYYYSWIPSDSLINPTNREPLTVPLHATTLFNLNTVDAVTGCIGTDDQVVVFVSGGPLFLEAYASMDNICQGELSQLFAFASGGSGNYTYLWLSNPPGFSSTSYDPVVQPNINTIYTVVVNDGTNTITDSVIINVNPSPGLYSVFGGGTYCDGNNGIEVLLDGSDDDVAYELFTEVGSTGIVVPGTGDAISFGRQTDESYYWAVGINSNNGCQNVMEDTVQVTIAELPIADAGEDQYINLGTSTQLYGNASSGSGYFNYNWYPDYLLVNPSVQNPVTHILNETSLFMLAVDDASSGCISNTDSVIIYMVNMPLTVAVSATPMQVCESSEIYLSALAGGGTGNYSYSWYSNPTGFYSNNPFPYAFPEESTTYIVEIGDGEATITDSVFVEVTPAPYIFEILGGGSYCKDGNGVNISLSGSEELIEYTLYRNQNIEVIKLIGDGLPLDFGETKLQGNYIVLARNQETDCLNQMAGTVVASQYPQPIADAGADISITSDSHATLNGFASGGLGVYSYLWMPQEKLLNPTDPDATTVALNQTTMFSLQVEDVTSGCESDPSNMVVFISGGPLDVNIVLSNNQVCPGEQISIYALPGGGSGNYSYFWESLPEGFNATSSEVIVNPSETTWYKVNISDGDEVVSDSVLITMLPLPESYSLLGGGGYCSGSGGVEVYLEGSTLSTIYTMYHNAVSTGYYVFGTGSQISFGDIITEGNYSVIAENEYGCSSLMNNVVQVSVESKPMKFQLYGGGTYCENDPTLGILLESSELQTDYELYKDAIPTSFVKQGSGLPLSFNGFVGTGNYSVVATGTETGCTSSMTGVAGLIINDKPEIEIFGDNTLCLGDSIVLSGSGGYIYEWNTVPPQYTPSIIVSPSETNSYILTGYNTNACSDTATHIVDVYDKPVITLINDPVLLSIFCYPDNLFNYDFYMGDVLIQYGQKNSWYYGDMGIISDTIVVVAKTESGCSDEEQIFVEMKEPPNAFTPNGDGKNDIFLEGHDITVFSSWGGEIYKGNTGWDGKHNGSLVVPGTYFYIHNIYNIDGSIIKTIKGSVTVVIE